MMLDGLLIVPDGIILHIFEQEKKAGRLPNLSRHVFERNLTGLETAIGSGSTFPSMQSFHTSMHPHDPGPVYLNHTTGKVINFLGRENFSRGYMAGRETIFHYAHSKKRFTACIHNPWHDGVDHPHPYLLSTKALFYAGLWEGTNKAAVRRYEKTQSSIRPSFMEIYLYSYDRFAHRIQTDRELAQKYCRSLDKYFGEIVKILKKSGQYDNTIISVVSDHSMSGVHRSFDLASICSEAGFNPRANNKPYPDSLTLASGYSNGKIYLFGGTDNLSVKLHRVAEHEAVDQVVLKHENSRIIIGKDFMAEYTKKDDKFELSYTGSPFDYGAETLQKLSREHTSRECFEATKNSDYPNALIEMYYAMEHIDSPNIIVLTKPQYDLGLTENVGGIKFMNGYGIRTHNAFHRKHLETVFYIAGPQNLKREASLSARLIDWGPTFLELSGREVPNVDGRTLLK